MINQGLALDKTITERKATLKSLEEVTFTKIYSYNRLPKIKPISGQIHFFKDGFEVLTRKKRTKDNGLEKYFVKLINENDKTIFEYIFKGKNYDVLLRSI